MRVLVACQFCSCACRACPPGPRASLAHTTLACSRDLAEGTPRCEGHRCVGPRCAGDPGGSENATEWSEEGRKHCPRLAPFAKGPSAPELRGGGVARPARSSLFREYPAGRPASGGGGGAGGEAGPASPPLGFPPGRYLQCLYRIRGRGARGPPGGRAASQYGIWPLRETECVCLCIYPARCNVILLVEGVCEIQY